MGTVKFSTLSFFLLLFFGTCVAPKPASHEEQTAELETGGHLGTPVGTQTQPNSAETRREAIASTHEMGEKKPHFIVNARLRNTDWSKIAPWIPSITALRIPGGSVSQYTWSQTAHVPKWLLENPKKQKQQTIITAGDIEAVKAIQEAHGISLYWCLNINDEIVHQLELIGRFEAAGVTFSHLEIGNETYLPKFRNGKKAGLGFVKTIDADDYSKIAVEWGEALADHPAQKLLVGASRTMDGSGGDNYRAAWNESIVKLINDHPTLFDGVAVHVYGGKHGGSSSNEDEEEAMENMDLSFLDVFALPIHITESGHKDVDWSQEGIELYKTFYRNLHDYLESRGDGSRCGAHVLYNPRNQPNHPYPLYDPNGITPLGEAAKDFPF